LATLPEREVFPPEEPLDPDEAPHCTFLDVEACLSWSVEAAQKAPAPREQINTTVNKEYTLFFMVAPP